MKHGVIITLLVALLVIFAPLTACKQPMDKPSIPPSVPTYTVTFMANGGAPVPESQVISKDGKVTEPPAMNKDGYTFAGWYMEPENINQWNFSSNSVAGDITLYAEWVTSVLVPGASLAAKLQWLNANVQSGGSYVMELTADEGINPTTFSYSGKDNITITIRGINSTRVITLNTTGSMFTVESGVTLILDGNLELQGRSDNVVPLICVNSGGNLVLDVGTKITGNATYGYTSTSLGSGVYVSGGTLTINGGEISSNYSWWGGGGVSISDGTVTMNNGILSNNKASSGGGVSLVKGTFTMNGGEISDNYGDWGGGIAITLGTFNMNKGKISGNSGEKGAGVFISNGIFNMADGKISNNTVNGSRGSPCCGSGLYVSNGIFNMNGGTISSNIIRTIYMIWGGGGVYMDNSILRKNGGTIYGYEDDDTNSNKIFAFSPTGPVYDTPILNLGSAIYTAINNSSFIKRKETTSGPNDDLFYDSTVAPPTWSGDWDY